MKLLFLTTMYPPSQAQEAFARSIDAVQHQVNHFQKLLWQGLSQQPTCDVQLLNALPVGVFPHQYRRAILRGGALPEGGWALGSPNVPWLKQKAREAGAARRVARWLKDTPASESPRLLVYSLYLPYLRAVARVKSRFPALRACAIVPDLPGCVGLPSGRTGLLKRVEDRWGRESLRLLEAFDGFVLLTEAMKDVLPVGDKPYIVMEGIAGEDAGAGVVAENTRDASDERPAVLYAGTLHPAFGIDTLLSAFTRDDMRGVALWVCGAGERADAVARAAEAHDNIRFFGFVPREEALALQSRAAMLINPRPADAAYTRYSFPSKTMEYLLSGKPVLCHALPCFPPEYAEHLRYHAADTPEAIARAVLDTLALSPEERAKRGEAARAFVLERKNAFVQAERALKLLARL